MITLGLGLLLQEVANSAHWLTGGSDGLQGIDIWPLLGIFQLRSLRHDRLWLFAGVAVHDVSGARRLVNSPFGLALRGIRENLVRMPAIGAAAARAYPQGLHHCRGHGRRRRRVARANDADGVA